MTFQDGGDSHDAGIVYEIFPFQLRDLQRLLALSYSEQEDGNNMIYYIKVFCLKIGKKTAFMQGSEKLNMEVYYSLI